MAGQLPCVSPNPKYTFLCCSSREYKYLILDWAKQNQKGMSVQACIYCSSKGDSLCFITSSDRWAKFKQCTGAPTYKCSSMNNCTHFYSLSAPRQVTIPGCKVKKEVMLVCRTPAGRFLLWAQENLAFLSPGKGVRILVPDIIKCVWK